MIDGGWLSPNAKQLGLVIAALAIVVLLFNQGGSGPMRISAWNGSMLSGGNANAGISGQAVAQSGRGLPRDPDLPYGNPLRSPNAVMTQGYGVGSHAPAEIWGAIDLAIDSNGDGQADPDGSWNAPIYATHSGIAKVSPNSVPAGNHVWVLGLHYKTGYAHLSSFAVRDGQRVERGQLIGYIGSTGQSSGPHLDYQVWENGVNINPLNFNVFENGAP